MPQDQAFGLQPGVEAVVRVPEMPGRTFPGKVTRIADALQPGTRTLLTEIDVPNPDGALTPGIYCAVELLDSAQDAVADRPADAVIFNRSGLQRRGRRERRRASAQDHGGARFRHSRSKSARRQAAATR